MLAAIGKIESDIGQPNLPGLRAGANPFGATGPMQLGVSGRAGPTFYLLDHPAAADPAPQPGRRCGPADRRRNHQCPGAVTASERVRRAGREDHRTECLDRWLVFSHHRLEVIVTEYLRHDNEARPHRSLDLAQPALRPVTLTPTTNGTITRREVLGGIIHELRHRCLTFHAVRGPYCQRQHRRIALSTGNAALGGTGNLAGRGTTTVRSWLQLKVCLKLDRPPEKPRPPVDLRVGRPIVTEPLRPPRSSHEPVRQ